MPKKNKSMKKKTAAASPATTVDLSSSTTIASSSSTTIDSSSATTVDLFSATTVDLSLSSSTTIASESESYIEMVRYLELDNCQLKQKVQSMEETFTREMSNMEAVYSRTASYSVTSGSCSTRRTRNALSSSSISNTCRMITKISRANWRRRKRNWG